MPFPKPARTPGRRYLPRPATTLQGDLFDLQKAFYAREDGVARVAIGRQAWLARMRAYARTVASLTGSVSSDDLREYAMRQGMEPDHPNAWGAVFRAPGWRYVGMTHSKLVSNHGRMIRRWAWDK